MNSEVIITLHPDLLEPVIERVVKRVLEGQRSSSRFEAGLSEQLLFTEQQAAERLGLTAIALKEERLKGRIRYVKRGRQVKYLPEHLVEYVDSWKSCVNDQDCG